MKKAIVLISTDWHLNKSNINEVLDLTDQQIVLAKKLEVSNIINLGDTFDQRKAQEEIVLNTFGSILDKFRDNNITLTAINGNHDRVNNDSVNSYLTPFQHYPNFDLIPSYSVKNFDLIPDYSVKDFGIEKPLNCHFLSYFNEDLYIKYLDKVSLLKNGQNILFTHIGLDGVLNNSNEEVKNPINKKLFKSFDKVFIGHYHNQSQVGDNIFYIGSLQPQNFGEDNNKGCTILYDDGSHEFYKLSFKEYEKVVIDINSFDKKKEQEFLQKYSKSNNHIRFEFTGDSSKISSIDKTKFESLGIDVKTKNKEVEETVNTVEFDEFIEFDSVSLLKEFDEFCEKNEIVEDKEIGLNYLKQQLKCQK